MDIKNIFVVVFLSFGFIYSVQAKEQKLTTKKLDWSINPSNFYSKETLKENKTCGDITMDFPHNIYFRMSSLFIQVKGNNPTVKW